MTMETSLPTYVFTSQIPTIVFAQAGTDPLTVRLNDGQHTFFESTLYPVNGKLSVYEVGKLYEEYFRSLGDSSRYPYLILQMQVGNLTWEDYMIIYCPFNCNLAAESFITTHFMTSLSAKRIPADCRSGDEQVYIVLTGEEDEEDKIVYVEATFRNPDGGTETHYCSFSGVFDELYGRIEASPSLIEGLFEHYCEEEIDYDWRELTPMSYSFRVGNRKLTYYVDQDFKPSVRFRFRNAFNLEETIYLEGETVTKTDTERSLATSHGVSLFYDQVDSQEFEVSTAPLTSEEAAWATQLLLSHKVMKVEDDETAEEVLITDVSSEVTDSDTEHRRLKFTYRLAKQGASLKLRENAFSNSRFTEVYSLHFA